MATRDIKTRFALEGEQKYKSAMKDAANAIKVLNSQEKLAKAQFMQTGDAQKYAATQADILKKKIEEQKAAVAAAEQAIKDLTANGVEPSSKQFQDWELKMNNAQTSLTKMETELQNLSQESTDANTQTSELGDTLGSLDKKANIDAVVKGVGKINDALGAAVTKVKELAKELINSIKESAAWADDLATQAIIYGMDVETLQRMRYAAEIIDTDVETIIKARQKLEQAMKSGKEDQFALFGVHTKRYGEFRNWEDVFWETGDALMHLTDGLTGSALDAKIIERDTAAMDLFGKSWRELLPLFTAGREKYDEVMNSTSVVSEENVGKLTELDDAIKTTNQELTTLKTTVEAALAPALTEVANSLTEMFKKLNEYLATEEGKEKLKALEDAVRELFSGLTDVDFGAALDKAKAALDKLKEGLNWIKDHKNQVIDAIKAIGLAFLGLKAIEGLGNIFQFINGAKGLAGKGGKTTATQSPTVLPTGTGTGGSGTGSAGGNASGTGESSANPATVTLGSLLNSLVNGMPIKFVLDQTGELLHMLDDELAGLTAEEQQRKVFEHDFGITPEEFEEWKKKKYGTDTSGGVTMKDAAEQSDKAFRFSEEQKALTEQIYDNWDDDDEAVALMDKLEEMLGKDVYKKVEDELYDLMQSGDYFGEDLPDTFFSDIEEALPEKAETIGKDSADKLGEGFKGEAGTAAKAAKEVGEQSSVGLGNGIDAKSDVAINAAKRLAGAVRDTLKSALKIGSPSKVMEEFGSYITEGLANGITGGLGVVNSAAATMARAVTGGVDSASFAGGFSAMTQDGQMVNVTLMIDSERLTSVVVPLVNQSMGEEINLMRR